MKAPYTQFDLPTKHLVGERHYIPPRARSSDEIERRRSMPRGTILLEQQHRGIQVINDVFAGVNEEPDIQYTANIIASCGLNSAWYEFGRNSKVMRRQVSLPYLARPLGQERPSRDYQLTVSKTKLERVADIAGSLVTIHTERKPGLASRSKLLGRTMADTALEVAFAPHADSVKEVGAFATQIAVRNYSLNVLDNARNMSLEIGTPPSFAQLADQDSDLSVHIRRTAEPSVFYAFEEAMSRLAMPR